jgi:hypothetical protein
MTPTLVSYGNTAGFTGYKEAGLSHQVEVHALLRSFLEKRKAGKLVILSFPAFFGLFWKL